MEKRNMLKSLDERAIRHGVAMRLSMADIARSIGQDVDYVVGRITELGLHVDYDLSARRQVSRKKAEKNGFLAHHRRWSKKEHVELYDLHSDGLSIEEIAKEMKRTPSAISNRLNLIYRGVLPGINPADFAEEKNHSRNEITAHDWGEKGQLGVVNSVSRFVIENEFFQASSFTNDKGETGVCIESKSGSTGLGNMSLDAFRSWQAILNLSQSWLSIQRGSGEVVMLSEHFASDDDELFRSTLLLS